MYARQENGEILIYHQLPVTWTTQEGIVIHNFNRADTATLASCGFLSVVHDPLPDNFIYGSVYFDESKQKFYREIRYAFAEISLIDFKKMKVKELFSILDDKFTATQDVYDQYLSSDIAIPERILAIRTQCHAKKQILLTALSQSITHEEVISVCDTLHLQINGIEDFDLTDEYFSESTGGNKAFKIEKPGLPKVTSVKPILVSDDRNRKSKYKVIRIWSEIYRLLRIKISLWYYHFKSI